MAPMHKVFLLLLAQAAVQGTPPPSFQEHTIATNLKGGYQVVAVDMNNDGKLDLIALASGMPELVWFENPSWERHVIVGGMNRMINLAARDVTGDGIPEIVLACDFANEAKNSLGTVYLVESQGDPRRLWKAREIDRLTTSHRLRWADIDGNGTPVVVNAPLTGATAQAPDYKGHTPLVFYRPGVWKRERVSEENEGVVHGLSIFDWDGDRKDDVLTASFSGLHVFRSQGGGQFSRVELASGNASELYVGHLGKSRFLATIEPWHGNQVCVYTKRGKIWDRHVIDDKITDGHTIQVADFNGDGREEVIAGFRRGTHSLHLYEAVDKRGTQWKRTVLDNGGMAAAACVAADLNGDHKIDLACIGSATANLKWYENTTR